jgi:hypothetical protein
MKYLSSAKYPHCGGYHRALGTVASIGDWGLFARKVFGVFGVFGGYIGIVFM